MNIHSKPIFQKKHTNAFIRKVHRNESFSLPILKTFSDFKRHMFKIQLVELLEEFGKKKHFDLGKIGNQ